MKLSIDYAEDFKKKLADSELSEAINNLFISIKNDMIEAVKSGDYPAKDYESQEDWSDRIYRHYNDIWNLTNQRIGGNYLNKDGFICLIKKIINR